MPLINKSAYRHPFWLPGGHVQSIHPTFFRRADAPPWRTARRIDTPDGDFLDLDLYAPGHGRLLILSHGMEGNARRKYIYGMAKAFLSAGWDVLAWNYRGCGPEINLRPRLYHCGDTADIRRVIAYALEQGYRRVILGGFSMGGAITLNYLGRHAAEIPPEVRGAFTFSVPCDLTACSLRLDQGFNRLYTANFLRTLRAKIRLKHAQFPEIFSLDGLDRIKSLKAFDDRYTAPLHGFASAEDYWDKSSCLRVLEKIRLPALLVNARNDPFLAGRCYPLEEARRNGRLYLELPESGGHVGFGVAGPVYWSERRALDFVRERF